MSTKLIKTIILVLVKPITIIINQMLIKGIFPDKLKIAKIIPIYKLKKDNETMVSLYWYSHPYIFNLYLVHWQKSFEIVIFYT